ncbi:hypothetical protein [Natrinema gelatinilyticum]|uniref:hypothetical protein n=1 Tax=Natrinema gelatinilyticum TaxID=2961571 RepID=UPI0020C1BF10|nr:hypothetical protein [Natrinema gelatinilyticum]
MSIDPTRLEGETFEGRSFTLEPWMAYLWMEATAGTDPDGDELGVPPTAAVLVAREAASLSTIENRLRGGEWDEPSVFLGGHRFSFSQPLSAGTTYRASAEIPSVERKFGSSGAFHVVTVTYDVTTDDGVSAYEMETKLVVRGPEE